MIGSSRNLSLAAQKLLQSLGNLIAYFFKDSELPDQLRQPPGPGSSRCSFFPPPGNTGHNSFALSQTVKT